MFKSLNNQKGTSMILFVLSLAVIVASASLAVDIGAVAVEKAELSAAVDAASLAGAQELISNSGNTSNVVNAYIAKNSEPLKQLDILINSTERTLEVKGSKTVDHYFARVFGKNTMDIFASAKAKIETIGSLKGARPLAVEDRIFEYGELYTLKEGAGDGTSGNYAAIALGGTGSSIYRDNLLYGYSGTINAGDLIQTETGNMSGTTETSINHLINGCTHSPKCTYQYYNKNCSRIIFIPIVNTLDVNGRKHVKVLGFGTFFLEGITNHGGKADVTGRFITYSMTGSTSNEAKDYGTYNIRLVE